MPLDHIKIRERRLKLGYSVTAAAEKSGLYREAWSKYEAGHALNVRLEAAEAIARTLNCSIGAITSPTAPTQPEARTPRRTPTRTSRALAKSE